jgi:hypothetical protein
MTIRGLTVRRGTLEVRAMPRHWWRRAAQPSPDVAPVPSPHLVAWAQVVDVSRLSDRTVSQAEDYLHGYRHMTPASAEEGAMRLMALVATQVSPPPPIDLQPLDVLATILAVRRKQPGVG